jgi:hypothetical protein
MFWKKTESKHLKSDEYEELTKKLVSVVGDIDVMSNRVSILFGNYRKLVARITTLKRKEGDDQCESDLKDDPLFI